MTYAFNCSVRGSSHIAKGIVCQDYSYAHSDAEKGVAIALVSDGHGSQKCYKSDIGSWLAVEVARWCLNDFHAKMTANDSCRLEKMGNEERETAIRQLFASIVVEWQRGIAWDLGIDAKLLTSEQMEVYGCTLMGYLQTASYYLAFQIGDGKLLVRDALDEGWSQPVPWDDDCFCHVTTSMCSSKTVSRFRYFFGDGNRPSAVCLGSDGIDDTFGDGAGLERFYNHVLDSVITDGVKTVVRQLPRVLKHYSEVGSHDDMSISVIINY